MEYLTGGHVEAGWHEVRFKTAKLKCKHLAFPGIAEPTDPAFTFGTSRRPSRHTAASSIQH